MTPYVTEPLRATPPQSSQRAAEALWAWHATHDLDKNPPGFMVEQAQRAHEAEQAGKKLPAGIDPDAFSNELSQLGGTLQALEERRVAEARMADRLLDIGRDPGRMLQCRHSGAVAWDTRNNKFVYQWDCKCGRALFCIDEARAEGQRIGRRDIPRVKRWLYTKGKRRRLFMVTVSPALVPSGRLEWAVRFLFDVSRKFRDRKIGQNIGLARETVEAPLAACGRWNPHMHAIWGIEGQFDYTASRRVLNEALRQGFPFAPADVIRNPLTGEVKRIEWIDYAPDTISKKPGRGCRLVCDSSRDVAVFSDGSRRSFADLEADFKSGAWCWGYKLTDQQGREFRIQKITHQPGSERSGDRVEFEGGDTMRLWRLKDIVYKGKLSWSAEPMSFQMQFDPIQGTPEAIDNSYREITKYAVKQLSDTGAGEGLPPDQPGSYGRWDKPPGLVDFPNLALSEWCDAMIGFHRSRPYRELYGRNDEAPLAPERSPIRYIGNIDFLPAQGRYSVYALGGRFWGSDLREGRHVDLIQNQKSEFSSGLDPPYKDQKSVATMVPDGKSEGRWPPSRVFFDDPIPF